jgi:hypothetical protein
MRQAGYLLALALALLAASATALAVRRRAHPGRRSP